MSGRPTTIPATVRVGGIDYGVETVDGLQDDDGTVLEGRIRHGKTQISVSANASAPMQRAVLWHEVIHAMLEQANVDCKERVVHVLAYGIMQVLRDNAGLRGE